MGSDLRALGHVQFTFPDRLRDAYNAFHLWQGRAAGFFFSLIFLVWCVGGLVFATVYAHEQPPLQSMVVPIGLPGAGILLTMDALGRIRLVRLVGACGAAVHVCAAAAGGERRPEKLRAVSSSVRSVERAVFRERRRQGTVARGRRFRNAALRQHAGRVVATLRAAEAQLDTTGRDVALRELSGLLATVADNAAAGRVGALLPESVTGQYEPVRNYGLLRLVAAVVTFLGASVAVAMFALPDAISGPVIAAVGLVSAIVAYGPEWRRFVTMIDFLGR